MPQPQLILADLDGTLVVRDDSVGPGVMELIDLAGETGGALIPVSARPLANIAELFKAVPSVSVAIGSGGGIVGEIGEGRIATVLHEETLWAGDGIELIDWMHTQAELGSGLTFLFRDSSSRFEVAIAGTSDELGRHLPTIVGDRPVKRVTRVDPNWKMLGVSLLGRFDAVEIGELLPPRLLPSGWRFTTYPEYRAPGWSWLEVLPKEANKASACRRLLGGWRTGPGAGPATIAVGDAVDDIEMFGLADRSYCPSTAPKEVRDAASEVLPQPGGEQFARAVLTRIEAFAGRGPEASELP